MPILSAIFLVLAMVLGVMVGPQTRPWSWGPSMLALALAVVSALPSLWTQKRQVLHCGLLAFGGLVVGWFGWRAWISPVKELGHADLMLMAGAVGVFLSVRAIEGERWAERILNWGLVLLLLANVVVIGKQVVDPNFSPLFGSRAAPFPSGFYAHYNEAANYLIASAMFVGAAALFGREARATRVLWGLVAVAGLAAVYFTRSRGGILGAAVSSGVFAGAALVLGKRSGARWFSPALIAIPLIGLGIGMFLLHGWESSQQLRSEGAGVQQVFDNHSRLYLLGIAASCLSLHPWTGGGSRSFSWESFQFIDVSGQGGSITCQPEFAHQELLQAATDYGLIGAALVAALLGGLVVIAVIRILFSEAPGEADNANAWRLGGLAALVGILVQSCFSFVFHLLPGALLLGLCLGQISRSHGGPGKFRGQIGSKIFLSVLAIASALILLPNGWRGTQATHALWNRYFSKLPATTAEAQIEALSEAIRCWPQSDLLTERAGVYLNPESARNSEALSLASRDYAAAAQLHDRNPGIAINLANLLSRQQLDQAAEVAYQRAIELQGGMETAFHGRELLAIHLSRKARRQFDSKQVAPTLQSLEQAAPQIEQAFQETRWPPAEIHQARVSVQESLGIAREASGDLAGAMAAYDFASTLPGGGRVNYRAAVLLGKMAVRAWAKREPSNALGIFIQARTRSTLSPDLPQGITPNQRIEYLTYLDQKIAFLRGAKIEPPAAK